MNVFDIFYICILFLSFWLGFIKGFFRSIIGPACLAFWSIIGILNYDLDNNIISAVSVTMIGSFICTASLQLLFFLGKLDVQQQHRNYVIWPSRILGGIFNLGWNGILVASIAIVLSLMPENFLGMRAVQKSISESLSYKKFYTYIITPFPVIENMHLTFSLFQDRALLQKYKETPEYQAVFSDPKIIRIIKDPNMMKKIQSHDGFFLLNDPALKDVLKDGFLMMKISELTKYIYHNEANR